MTTQTSLVAERVRLQEWAEQITACQNRPAGMDVSTWCQLNNISKSNYYYRLRRVRKSCLDQISDTTGFVEIPQAIVNPENVSEVPVDMTITEKQVPAACLRTPTGISVDLYPGISQDLLSHIMEAALHVK